MSKKPLPKQIKIQNSTYRVLGETKEGYLVQRIKVDNIKLPYPSLEEKQPTWSFKVPNLNLFINVEIIY